MAVRISAPDYLRWLRGCLLTRQLPVGLEMQNDFEHVLGMVRSRGYYPTVTLMNYARVRTHNSFYDSRRG
jgi:hypothetical protein